MWSALVLKCLPCHYFWMMCVWLTIVLGILCHWCCPSPLCLNLPLRDLPEEWKGAAGHCEQELWPPSRSYCQGSWPEEAHLPAHSSLRSLWSWCLFMGGAKEADVLNTPLLFNGPCICHPSSFQSSPFLKFFTSQTATLWQPLLHTKCPLSTCWYTSLQRKK